MSAKRPGRRSVRALIDRYELHMSRSRRIDGIWVGCVGEAAKDALAFSRLEQALLLIKTYDPLRYAHLRHDLDRILVYLLPGNWGEFHPALNMCVLDERFVLAETTRVEQIASTIVHEATHARLRRCGIGYTLEIRARVEAVCFRRERAFSAKLPEGASVRDEAELRLTGYPADFWTPRAFQERFDQGTAEALRYLDMPEAFIRAVFRLRDLIAAARRLARRVTAPFRGRR